MFTTIEMPLFNGETKDVEFMANAATPRRYKMIFGDDLLSKFANAERIIDGKTHYDIDFLPELSFVMAMQARALSDEKFKLEKLNPSMFLDWLEQFDSMAFENKSQEIMDLYLGNTETSSQAKKNTEKQSEK